MVANTHYIEHVQTLLQCLPTVHGSFSLLRVTNKTTYSGLSSKSFFLTAHQEQSPLETLIPYYESLHTTCE